jgi:dTDP-4-amino-4,6-dideoxygalactose transaminase
VTCTRNEFMAAVGAEGVQVAAGSAPDNYLDAVFAEQLGYGSTKCPFACPWYQRRVSYEPGLCPVAEDIGRRVVTLEVWPTIEEKDCDDVLAAITKVTEA